MSETSVVWLLVVIASAVELMISLAEEVVESSLIDVLSTTSVEFDVEVVVFVFILLARDPP